MAFEAMIKTPSMSANTLTRQQEAEMRLQEPSRTSITTDQTNRVRTNARRQQTSSISTSIITNTKSHCSLQARKPFRRRTHHHQNKIAISNEKDDDHQLSTLVQATNIAINRDYNEAYKLSSQKRQRRRSSLSLLSSCPSSLLLSISFTFTIVTLVNLMLLQPAQIVAASSNGANQGVPTTAQTIASQQQSNSVIQMPPTIMSASTAGPTTTMTTSGKARYKTMYACEDRQLTMDCDFGSKINLIRANFGRFSITQCNDQGTLDLSTDCMSPITFRIMKDRCEDRQKCSVNATSMIFGDRCPTTRKYLEVHFQCTPDNRVLSLANPGNLDAPDRVDLRNSSQLAVAAAGGLPSTAPQATQSVVPTHSSPTSYLQQPSPSQAFNTLQGGSASSSILPPNNPSNAQRQQPSVVPPIFQPHQQEDFNRPLMQHQQQPMTVMNSEIMSYNHASNSEIALSKLQDPNSNREPIIVTMRHTHIDNMSNPRCVLWDQAANQWTERGSQIVETNQTHTICAFDQATSYLLVMDHMAPASSASSVAQSPTSTISNFNQVNHQRQQHSIATQPPTPSFGPPISDILENQPVVLDQQILNRQQSAASNSNNTNNSSRVFSLFSYLLVALFIAIVFMTIAFVASSLRNSSSSAGAAFKSLGNFAALSGGNSASKYKHRRQDIMTGGPGSSLHSSNKDLLVINNSNGHQFLYAPASTTKINSSSSTHILSAAIGDRTTNGQPAQHQGTLHRVQQQMYSVNGATLSSLSAAGTQSNNYYYGLMGLNPLFQQQQQHHFSQHHVNQAQQPPQQIAAQSYNHQANKSTISTESANSSSSSGVESGSTSVQQQPQTQQACLVTSSGAGNDFNLLNNHYGQTQQLNPFQQQQPTLTLNAHYSTSGAMQPINMTAAQQIHHHRQLSNQMRDHIYETVDYEKPYMSRLLMSMNNPNEQQQQFGTIGHHQHQIYHQQQLANNQQLQQRTMTLSSRLLHDPMQNQSQQQQQSSASSKRFPQPAIVRDHQATKTNIICSKLAQVTPQRATEIGKSLFGNGHHDMMTIYNGNDASTTTTTTTASTANAKDSTTTNSCFSQRLELNSSNNGVNKLSTDC